MIRLAKIIDALIPAVTPLTISSEWNSGYVNLLKIGGLTAVGITNLRRTTATSGYVDVATLPADIDISTKAYFIGFPFYNSSGTVRLGAMRITNGKVQFNTSNSIPDYGVYALIVYA